MVQLAQWQERFAAHGINVAAMTYDDTAVLAEFHRHEKLGYPLLQDENAKHANAYGIRNEHYQPGDSGYGVPHPGVLLLDRDGIIKRKFANPGFKNRPSFEAIYEAISGP